MQVADAVSTAVQTLSADGRRRLNTLRAMVGNTQLVVIDYRFRGRLGKVCAKAEHLNFSGSIKDRMALHILESAYADGTLRPGDCIVEATSGNTGIAFAALGSAMGHPVTIYMPDWMSRERHDLIRSYGGKVESVTKEQVASWAALRYVAKSVTHVQKSFCRGNSKTAPTWRRMREARGRSCLHSCIWLGCRWTPLLQGWARAVR